MRQEKASTRQLWREGIIFFMLRVYSWPFAGNVLFSGTLQEKRKRLAREAPLREEDFCRKTAGGKLRLEEKLFDSILQESMSL
jgi:hypothetical protein